MSRQGPTPEPEFQPVSRDTEIAVAAFRTVFLLIVILSPQFLNAWATGGALIITLVVAATVYNLALFVLHIRNTHVPRLLILVFDVLLVSLWIFLSLF